MKRRRRRRSFGEISLAARPVPKTRGRQLYEGPKMNAKGKCESIQSFYLSSSQRGEGKKREKILFHLGIKYLRHTAE